MYLTLRNEENMIVESTRHKIKVTTNYTGEISVTDIADKQIQNISEELMDKQIDKKLKGYTGWDPKSLERTREFIKDMAEKGSKALKIDKNKLVALMLERCDYSAVNYFQHCNFYDFKTTAELKAEISKLRQEAWDKKKSHDKEVIGLQQKITEAKGISVSDLKVDASRDYSVDIYVNCPHCDAYQNVGKHIDDPGWDEITIECEKCGKAFNVEVDK